MIKEFNLRDKNLYIITAVLFYIFLFLIIGIGNNPEPTLENENKAIQYKIDFCKSKNWSSDLELKEEGKIYFSWSLSYSFDCYDNERLKYTFYQNAYKESGADLECSNFKYINIFSLFNKECWN